MATPTSPGSRTVNAFRNLDILNLDRIADIQAAHIHIDEIGQVGGQTGDLQFPFEMLEFTAVLDADRGTDETERDIERQFVVHADFIKIGMIEPSADRFDLQFLDQGELFLRFLSLDEQFDEDIFLLCPL